MELPTKAVKRALRELAARAHGEDLRRALLPVSVAFDRWKAGELGSGDLAQIIHEFHDGPARELYKLYNGDHRWAVAYAIANDILSVEAVPVEVLEYCRPAIEPFKEREEE
jgi:hypothetical protein